MAGILVVVGDESTREGVVRALASVNLKVDAFVGDERPQSGKDYRLAVIELGPGLEDPTPLIEGMSPLAHVVLVVPTVTLDVVSQWTKDPRINHFFAAPLGNKQLHHLRYLGLKLATGDIFGVERYLATEWELGYRRVSSVNDRSRALSRLSAFIKRGTDRGYADRALVGAERLLLHAMYVAPVDDRGRPLNPGEALVEDCLNQGSPSGVSLRYARRGSHFFISVRDRYGSLSREGLLAGLANPIEDRVASGIRVATKGATRVMVNLLPARVLEVICCYEQTAKGLSGFSFTAHRPEVAKKVEPDQGTDIFGAIGDQDGAIPLGF